MRKIYNIKVENAAPRIEDIFQAQGVPVRTKTDDRTYRIAEEAISIFRQKAFPTGIIMEISKDEFAEIFQGEGNNSDQSPVKPIYEESIDLALFALTIEEDISSEIGRLFKTHDFALGSMLDSAASEGTDMAAALLEDIYRQRLKDIKRWDSRRGTLRFSPGYCGWHISGQKRLFKALHPEDIGITLNSSYLMQPIKSVSGVIISGPKDIFDFDDTFYFCADCATHGCKERLKNLMEQ